ncbi:hypothetical protein [Methylobacterium iners]|uniref:ABC transporter ATPase n=1 Tax=Methylobacterium iners TaxID=418707 RepID=A0ABQ4S4N6_9HYPH|nr:hypothetical protein [Methylobacterium iners]GJD97525.1 hypothetical protein OCOJLMKI_4757 [Methylobacterium iners]
MRTILPAALLLVLAAPARADSCGDLIDRVVAGTEARLVKRSADFAELAASDDITMTLACGGLSAVGVQFRGEALPKAYFPLVGRAGRVVTGIETASITEAAKLARENAARTRHSHVDAGSALVTCSVVKAAVGLVTACAVIEKDERR